MTCFEKTSVMLQFVDIQIVSVVEILPEWDNDWLIHIHVVYAINQTSVMIFSNSEMRWSRVTKCHLIQCAIGDWAHTDPIRPTDHYADANGWTQRYISAYVWERVFNIWVNTYFHSSHFTLNYHLIDVHFYCHCAILRTGKKTTRQNRYY